MKKISSFKITFVNSIKNLFRQKTTYILLVISIFLVFAVLVIVPAILAAINGKTYGRSFMWWYNNPNNWIEIDSYLLFIIISFVSSMIAEKNTPSTEKIYALSKPISRDKFLLAKCLSSLFVSFILMFVILVLFISIDIAGIYGSNKSSIFIDGLNGYSYLGGMITIWLFASILSTLYSYQSQNGIMTLLCTAIILIYIVIFAMFSNLSNDPNRKTPTELVQLQRLLFSSLLFILLPFTYGFGHLAWWIFKESEIES